LKRLLYIAAFTLAVVIASPPMASKAGGEVFFERHWSRPVRIRGQAGLKEVLPGDCGVCHAEKLSDWSGSLHSRSTGPGLLSQVDASRWPGYALGCYRCHAPAIEQNEKLRTTDGYAGNPAFDPGLKAAGVSCAVCHVRHGVVNGPVRAGDAAGRPSQAALRAHPTRIEPGFSSSRLCAACHQLSGGFEPGGKPLVNTYAEWEASDYAARGVTCQNCHMPGRRHLFRGIHDPGTVRAGLEIKAVSLGPAALRLTVTNTGVGHEFPTYVTPLVVMRAFLVDASGDEIEGTRREEYIGRMVSSDLSREIYDTRLSPGEARTFEYRPGAAPARAAGVAVEVRVRPDEFYRAMFKSALSSGAYVDRGLMQKALERNRGSEYLLYREVFNNPLTSGRGG